jgi:hypothetical protein
MTIKWQLSIISSECEVCRIFKPQMPAYAIGEKAADLIKGLFLKLSDPAAEINMKEKTATTSVDVNENGSFVLN